MSNTLLYTTFGVIILVALTILLLLLSMDSILPLHYGITYNKISKYVSSEVYDNGRYLIGPFSSFIIYPGYLVNIEFSNSRMADVKYFI
jgi:hypothetical protein